jgi:molybdenum cofactor cytidylyltransferase
MEFGNFLLNKAEGAILAHSHRLPERALKKGRLLSAEDITLLRSAGYQRVVCARIEVDDILENDAADKLATAVCGANLSKAAAFTGRCNLFAETDGLVIYDPQRLNGFNLVDETITLGVVPPYQMVTKGQMVATLKIIPFALPQTIVTIAQLIAVKSKHLIQVAPFNSLKTGLVQSRLSGTKESVLNSTREVTEARLRTLSCDLSIESRCAHNETAMAEAIAEMLEKNVDLLLISGASAVVDRRDVVPAAIEQAGGAIQHFGMPVDPGNLMLMARIGETPVIGMPGCARSPKLNGFDWVLQRLVAKVPAEPRDIMRMGIGGLLKDVATRPLPRAKARRDHIEEEAPPTVADLTQEPRIAALVLAAGQSRRMGYNNKLLAEIDGTAMVRRTAQNVLASKASPVVAVTGHQRTETKAVLAGLDLAFAHNAGYADGLSTSMKAGLASLDTDLDGLLICLGDMPRVLPQTINKLIAAFDPQEGRAICVPTWHGKRGNPVLWGRRFFEEMMDISGDVGARHLMGKYSDLLVEVEMNDDGIMIDVDTPDALAEINVAFIGKGPM